MTEIDKKVKYLTDRVNTLEAVIKAKIDGIEMKLKELEQDDDHLLDCINNLEELTLKQQGI